MRPLPRAWPGCWTEEEGPGGCLPSTSEVTLPPPPAHFPNAQQASGPPPPPQQPQAEPSECVGQVRLEGLGAGPKYSEEGAQSRWGQQAHVVHMRGALWGTSPGMVPLAPPAQPGTAQ